MGFLDRAIKNGISRGVSNAVSSAVSGAVKQVVEPKATAYANKVADGIDRAAQQTQQTAQQTQQSAQQAARSASGLEGAFANLQSSMESYATQAAKNTKICPKCGAPATADKKFCPSCGAKLPEETLAQGAVCPKCGKQNTVGTKFCQECGAKLPFAEAEEKAEAEKNAAVLANWSEQLPAYPVWNCGGTDLRLEKYDDYFCFTATLENDYAAQNAVNKYRETLKQNGFRQAGQYPSDEHLYKKVGGTCYHADTEHCFEGDSNAPSVYFNVSEPAGGYDYVKPEPQKKSGWRDLFNF